MSENAGKEFSVRTELMQLIAKTGDDDRRMVWMMMLGILEQQEAGFDRIERKIDAMLADEQSLRETVLNGHAKNHDGDHEWLFERRKADPQVCAERRWVQERMAEDCEKVCEWTRKKMQEEQEDAKANKASARKLRDTFIERTLWTVLTLAALGAGMWWK